MKLSVVIPMYNESEIIFDTVAQLRALADENPEHGFEFVLVNDGSRDDTADAAKKVTEGDERFVVTGYDDNRGKGAAVRFGMLASSGEVRVFTDCDLAYGTDNIVKIADKLVADGTDITIGSRNLSDDGYAGYTPLRRFMSKTYIKVISVAAGFSHSDSQSGIKAFTAKCADDIFSKCEVNRFAFDLEALIIAEKLGYKVSEMPVSIINHREARSKVSPIKDTLRMLRDIGKIKKRTRKLSRQS